MTTRAELERTLIGFSKRVHVKGGGHLALVSGGNSRYYIGIQKKGESGYSALTSHLTRKEMQELVWDYNKLISQLTHGDLRLSK
jgi:hypothetical protein